MSLLRFERISSWFPEGHALQRRYANGFGLPQSCMRVTTIHSSDGSRDNSGRPDFAPADQIATIPSDLLFFWLAYLCSPSCTGRDGPPDARKARMGKPEPV